MKTYGMGGRSARHYGDEMATLKGLLASDGPRVYPDNYCLECIREGKTEDERCFHKHWQGKGAQ